MDLRSSDFVGRKLRRAGTVPVLFVASWCPFCRKFKPFFQSTLNGAGYEAAFADLTEERNPLWDAFAIDTVPTAIVFKDGEIVLRRDGEPGIGLPRETMSDVLRAIGAEANPAPESS